jgi:hypothetical protein
LGILKPKVDDSFQYLLPLKKGEKLLSTKLHSTEEYFDAENLKVGSSILPIARQLILFMRCAKE